MDLGLVNPAVRIALDGLMARQEAIAHNVANLTTPNFTATNIEFESELKSALETPHAAWVASTADFLTTEFNIRRGEIRRRQVRHIVGDGFLTCHQSIQGDAYRRIDKTQIHGNPTYRLGIRAKSMANLVSLLLNCPHRRERIVPERNRQSDLIPDPHHT
jgi:flagellar basal body rod protein FlgF